MVLAPRTQKSLIKESPVLCKGPDGWSSLAFPSLWYQLEVLGFFPASTLSCFYALHLLFLFLIKFYLDKGSTLTQCDLITHLVTSSMSASLISLHSQVGWGVGLEPTFEGWGMTQYSPVYEAESFGGSVAQDAKQRPPSLRIVPLKLSVLVNWGSR